MIRYLLDVNILLGIAWEDQRSHKIVFPWFQQIGRLQFATCAITQSGFVRISTSARLSPNPVPIKAAMELLATLTSMPGHEFWPIGIGLVQATKPCIDKLFGPQQLTDAYLLGLAIANDSIFVTRDQAIPQLAGKDFAKHVLLLA